MSAERGQGSNGAGPERTKLRLGGMALRNGLLIHGPTSWAVAARTPEGELEVASGPKPVFSRGRLGKVPVLRGPLRLAEALAVVPLARYRLASARLAFEDPRVIAAAVASLAVSSAVRRSGERRGRAGGPLREAVVALLGLVPALAALRDHDLAAYHGVEHKAIAAYEVDTDPADMPKEHPRCGSNLIVPMMATSIAGQVLVELLLDEPGPIARGAATIAGVGSAVELFLYAERNPESAAARAVHGPGHEIQRLLSTREPTVEQLEVGRAALAEVLRVEAEAADE
ncbi:MAG TPA: DUF1385 domain-containing protein [Solirubrobacterales bacterium]|nr:DUF1385 domain-containing protein [Solirubrobacterales bacterium]